MDLTFLLYVAVRMQFGEFWEAYKNAENDPSYGYVSFAAARFACFVFDMFNPDNQKTPEQYLVGSGTQCFCIQDFDGIPTFYVAVVTKGTSHSNELNKARKNITATVRIQLGIGEEESLEEHFKWGTFLRHYKRFQKIFIAFVIMNNFKAVTMEQCKDYIYHSLGGIMTKRRLEDFEKTFAHKCVSKVSWTK